MDTTDQNKREIFDILFELEPILDQIVNMSKIDESSEEIITTDTIETKEASSGLDDINVLVNGKGKDKGKTKTKIKTDIAEAEKEEESLIPQGTVQIIESKIVTKGNGEVFGKELPPENIIL